LPSLFGEYLPSILAKTKAVILYGAGSAGRELFECLNLHEIEVSCFCDKNKSLIGGELHKVPVISVDELIKHYKNAVIVVASNNYKYEITDELTEHGFQNITFIEDDKQLFYYLQIYKWHYALSTLDENKVEAAYHLLEDSKSKELFKKRVALLTSYADYDLFNEYISEFSDVGNVNLADFSVSSVAENFESYLYFNNDVLSLHNNETVIDAGAFDGDSAIEFIKACKRNKIEYRQVYCIEADADNYKKLKQNMDSYTNVTCLPVGLWSESVRLRFATSSSMFVTESRIVDDAIEMNHGSNVSKGDTYIDTVSIDERFISEKVSFIKMDIEGAETEAIRGAMNIIKRDKPKLAISIYHKKEDIYEIPLLINEICPEYKFYLRHFSSHLCETVLLATT